MQKEDLFKHRLQGQREIKRSDQKPETRNQKPDYSSTDKTAGRYYHTQRNSICISADNKKCQSRYLRLVKGQTLTSSF